MRTTLKRGIGRGAELNGNGHAVLPPRVLTPMSRYRQPPGQGPGIGRRIAGFFFWVLILVAMVAALVLIAGSWYAGQQGSLSEPTQQARIIAGAVGGLAGKEPAAPELNAVLRAVARGELQLLVAPSPSALDVAQRMAQTTLHDIAYIVIIGSSSQPLERRSCSFRKRRYGATRCLTIRT